jgi:phosphosulfolactate synthase (CoM biosynthesis protein A)
MPSKTKDQIAENAFAFLRTNERASKPRKCGVTEMRGPYYTPLGKRQLEDILETMGNYVDALKFAGGSFSLMLNRLSAQGIDLNAVAEKLQEDGAAAFASANDRVVTAIDKKRRSAVAAASGRQT